MQLSTSPREVMDNRDAGGKFVNKESCVACLSHIRKMSYLIKHHHIPQKILMFLLIIENPNFKWLLCSLTFYPLPYQLAYYVSRMDLVKGKFSY